MEPRALVAAVILTVLLVLIFVQDGWRSASGALLIALTVLVLVRLLGLWAW